MFKAQKADIIDRLSNDPTILSWVSPGSKPLEHAPCFEQPYVQRCRFYHNGSSDDDANASAAVSFGWSSPNVWEMHVMALPSARGKPMSEFTQQCIEDMFYKEGAKEIWGRPPVRNVVVRSFVRKVGGISRGFAEDPVFGEVELFATSKAEWEGWKQRVGK